MLKKMLPKIKKTRRLEKKCFMCNKQSSYKPEYDAVFCNECNIWLEKKCEDLECFFCSKRPQTPNEKLTS